MTFRTSHGSGRAAALGALITSTTVASAQSSFAPPAPDARAQQAPRTLRLDLVDADRAPLAGPAGVYGLAPDGATVKGVALGDGSFVIPGLTGITKLVLEHDDLGAGSVIVDLPSPRPGVAAMVMLHRGRATLLPHLADTVAPGAGFGGSRTPVAGLSDCCFDNGTPGCDDPVCEALVCAEDSFCCDFEWDDLCAELAVELCDPLCDAPGLECPAEGIDEPEPCGDSTNGGCPAIPPAFTSASCGDTYCGTAWADGGSRDTDWYLVDVPDPDGDGVEQLGAALVSQFAGLVAIMDVDQGACGSFRLIGDAGCADFGASIEDAGAVVSAPGTYAVLVGAGDCLGDPIFDGFPCGGGNNEYNVTITCGPAEPPPPFADDCADAVFLPVPAELPGTTRLATFDAAPPCGVSQTGPGVWYRVDGTGTTITASTCGAASFDTRISVYCGACPTEPGSTCCFANGTPGCDDPECEALVCAIDTFCCDVEWDAGCAAGANSMCETCLEGSSLVCVAGADDTVNCDGFTTEVSWCSEIGAEYLILVHGAGEQVGEFTLTLTDDGVPCDAPLLCLPAGACCFAGGACEITTPEDCAAQGGDYQGDGTDCGELVYDLAGCQNDFEDISATGVIAPNASTVDDGGDLDIPIGFTFHFFGTPHDTIGIASNGYLTFGNDVSNFTNDPIPSTESPNDLIAPYWDDWSPDDGGDVRYQTLGTAPNRRFIAQWTQVPHFDTGGTATFQAVLHEGSGCVQYRYGTPLEFESPTSGIENADGTAGVELPPAAPGDCADVCPSIVGNPCTGGEACFTVVDEEVHCHPDGETFTWIIHGFNSCTDGPFTVVNTASGGAVGEQFCVTIVLNDEQGGFCCLEQYCIEIPDCAQPALPCDLDGDGSIGTSDLMILLREWGGNAAGPPDLDADGEVGPSDLLALLGAWGPCD